MSDPMPTANEIRDGYAMNEFGEVNDHWAADFDRWIFAHDAEVARKAAEVAWEIGGADHMARVNALTDMGPDYPIPVNPYRAEQIGEK